MIHTIYAFLGKRFRRRRMQLFVTSFSLTARTQIIDLGGSPETWRGMLVKPQVTLLNLDPACLRANPQSVVADALACPFPDENFDFAFSNSLIEHLGTAERQRQFAEEIRRLTRNGYFVQTPNKWFPIEPHYLAPFIQFVPARLKPAITRWLTPWGLITRPSPQRCVQVSREIRLLDARELGRLFPEAEIVRERFLGFTKSLIAIRRPQAKLPVTERPS